MSKTVGALNGVDVTRVTSTMYRAEQPLSTANYLVASCQQQREGTSSTVTQAQGDKFSGGLQISSTELTSDSVFLFIFCGSQTKTVLL